MRFIADLMKGLSILGILTSKIPMYMLDGKITIDEMADLTKSVCDAAGWDIDIAVPDDIRTVDVGMKGI